MNLWKVVSRLSLLTGEKRNLCDNNRHRCKSTFIYHYMSLFWSMQMLQLRSKYTIISYKSIQSTIEYHIPTCLNVPQPNLQVFLLRIYKCYVTYNSFLTDAIWNKNRKCNVLEVPPANSSTSDSVIISISIT